MTEQVGNENVIKEEKERRKERKRVRRGGRKGEGKRKQ